MKLCSVRVQRSKLNISHKRSIELSVAQVLRSEGSRGLGQHQPREPEKGVRFDDA